MKSPAFTAVVGVNLMVYVAAVAVVLGLTVAVRPVTDESVNEAVAVPDVAPVAVTL
jgi:hypothetical protein